THEDSHAQSGAGQYLTIPNVCSWSDLTRAVDRVRAAGANVSNEGNPIIIQVQIEPTYAGVIFPTDPISTSKDESHVAVTVGHAGGLVSGSRSSSLFEVTDVEANRIEGDLEVDTSLLSRLRKVGRQVEQL